MMWNRTAMITMIFGLVAAAFFQSRPSTLVAQEIQDTYLPFVSGPQESPTADPAQTPIDALTPTPTATPSPTSGTVGQFEAAWNPPATATPTAAPSRTYPEWVPGTYNVRQYKSEGWAEYLADGTYTERYADFGSEEIGTEVGEWFVVDGGEIDQMVAIFTNQDGELQQRRYIIEQVGDDGFRLSAGDANVYSYFYERVTPVKAVDGENVSRWVQGRWNLTLFLDFNAFFFEEDGTYEMYKIASYEQPEGDPAETGQWSAFANTMIIQPDGASIEDSTYTIVGATKGFLNLTGGRIGAEEDGMLRGTVEQADSLLAYEGQYTADSTTINVDKVGDGTYTAQILTEGESTSAMGTVDENGQLILSTDERTYDPLFAYFNALFYDSFELPEWLTKMSTTRLPLPQSLHGLWVDQGSSSGSERWFLPDGRYISKFGSIQTEGTYTIEEDAIIFDPLCESPSSNPYTWTENQLVFPSDLATLTFHYVPLMLPDLMASVAARDEREALTNFDFASNTAPLGLQDSRFIEPAAGEISVDVNRDNVFADAVVFAGQQLYTWPQELSYYLDNSGNLVPVTLTTCALGGCSGLDLSQGWQDKFHYWFFPNGRVTYYHESYLSPASLSPVTPSVTRTWGKYKIEDEQIIIETDLGETLNFDMTIGRRRAVLNEICFENFEWTTADDGR